MNLVLPLTTLFVQLGRNILKKNAHMGLVHPAMPKTSLKRRRRRAGLMACVMTSLYQMSLLHGRASAEHQIFSISVWWANFAAEN